MKLKKKKGGGGKKGEENGKKLPDQRPLFGITVAGYKNPLPGFDPNLIQTQTLPTPRIEVVITGFGPN